MQSAYFVLIARLLGPREYGLYAAAFALTNILGQYSSLGSGTLFLRYVSADRSRFAVYWGNILATTTLVSALIVAALAFVSGRLFAPGGSSITLLAGIASCFCYQITACAAKVFQTYEQLRITAALTLSNNFARTVAAGAMLLLFHRASAYQWTVATLALSLLMAAASVLIVTVRFGAPRFSLRQMRRDGLEGLGFSFAGSTSTAYNDIDKTMLGHFGMNVANGIYSMAYRVIDVATVPIVAIREAAMPRFFKRGTAGIAGSAELAMRLLKRALPLSLLAAVCLFVAAPLIPRLVGDGFRETVPALRWLCLIPVFRSIHQMTGSAITGSGFQRYRTLSQVLAVVLNVGLNLWLIPQYSWRGAAWSSLATDGMLAIANCAALAVLYRMAVREPVLSPAVS